MRIVSTKLALKADFEKDDFPRFCHRGLERIKYIPLSVNFLCWQKIRTMQK